MVLCDFCNSRCFIADTHSLGHVVSMGMSIISSATNVLSDRYDESIYMGVSHALGVINPIVT